MTDSAELHRWVAEYNWDDGFDPIWPIVENPETEFGTALLIYWRVEGPYLAGGSDEAAKINETVRERLLQGFYTSENIEYQPIDDYQLSKVQVYKLLKAGHPRQLIEPEY